MQLKNDPAPALPCRGCTMDCPYRLRCEGKPWRALEEARAEVASKESQTHGP